MSCPLPSRHAVLPTSPLARPPDGPVVRARTLNWTCGSPWAAIAAILRERAATARAPHKGRGREERAGRRGRGVRRLGGEEGKLPEKPVALPVHSPRRRRSAPTRREPPPPP